MDSKKLETIKKIISHSGNNLHSKVVKFLKEKDWTVIIAPYYRDSATGKSREIDIVAEKNFSCSSLSSFNNTVGYLKIRLFIECKYFNKENVFWFDAKDINHAEKMVTSTTPLKPHSENINIERHHYYSIKEVAKLFSSNQQNESRIENEQLFKALSQSLNAMTYYKVFGSFSGRTEDPRIPILHEIEYPIIICNNFENFFRTDLDETEPTEIEDNFQIEVNYGYLDPHNNNRNEYFLVDVVNFSKFDEFLTNLKENDIHTVSNILSYNQNTTTDDYYEYDNGDPD